MSNPNELPDGATIEEDVGFDGADEYYEEGDDLDDSDLQNLEEIEKFHGQINADDYEELTEEERQMHELELEMDKAALEAENSKVNSGGNSGGSGSSGGAFLPAGAVPSKNGVLSPHAAEFWFPESRNCPCCSGFKHGCKCRSPTVDTCKHPECENLEYKEQVASTLASRGPAEPSTANTRGSSGGGYKIEPPESPRGGAPPEICKFFLQGSCMRGNSCRFVHSSEGGNASPASPSGSRGYAPAGGMSPSQECIYFKRGNCQFGDSCRFQHISAQAYPPQPPY